MSILLPGETAYPDITTAQSNIYITKGFVPTGNSITATYAGTVTASTSTLRMISSSKTYYPSVGDQVVGIIKDRLRDEGYIVDIHSYRRAILPLTAFDGATRKNQNILKVFILHY